MTTMKNKLGLMLVHGQKDPCQASSARYVEEHIEPLKPCNNLGGKASEDCVDEQDPAKYPADRR